MRMLILIGVCVGIFFVHSQLDMRFTVRFCLERVYGYHLSNKTIYDIYIYILDVGVSYETIERHPSGLHLDLELNIQKDVENLWGNPRTRIEAAAFPHLC